MTRKVPFRSGTRRSAPAVPRGSSSQCHLSSRSSGSEFDCEKYTWISSPRWPTQMSTSRAPDVWSRRRMCSRIGRSPTGTSGLGNTVVYGCSRVPSPPARMTALICTSGTVAGYASLDLHKLELELVAGQDSKQVLLVELLQPAAGVHEPAQHRLESVAPAELDPRPTVEARGFAA